MRTSEALSSSIPCVGTYPGEILDLGGGMTRLSPRVRLQEQVRVGSALVWVSISMRGFA